MAHTTLASYVHELISLAAAALTRRRTGRTRANDYRFLRCDRDAWDSL